MTTLGDGIDYVSLVLSAIALLGLLLKEQMNSDILDWFASPMVFLTAGLLTFDFLLLTYYFVTSDFSLDYVWSYSSRDLPLIYKLNPI